MLVCWSDTSVFFLSKTLYMYDFPFYCWTVTFGYNLSRFRLVHIARDKLPRNRNTLPALLGPDHRLGQFYL